MEDKMKCNVEKTCAHIEEHRIADDRLRDAIGGIHNTLDWGPRGAVEKTFPDDSAVSDILQLDGHVVTFLYRH